MKSNLILLFLLFGIVKSYAQNQNIDGNVSIGLDGGEITGRGKTLYFNGVQFNTDELSIYRFNRSMNQSDLRFNIGDDYGSGGDRLVIGTFYWADQKYYTHLVVADDGKVGIGTETFGDERLAVNGKIRSREIKVDGNGWPDYVFSKSYLLPSLKETEEYIKEKGYLPGMPSAKEIERDGLELGTMNKKLMQKIEELTLHLIKKEKDIDFLKQENKQLKNDQEVLRKDMNHILKLVKKKK